MTLFFVILVSTLISAPVSAAGWLECSRQGRRWDFHSGAPLAGTVALTARPQGARAGLFVASQEGYVHRLSQDGQFRWSYTLDSVLAFGVTSDVFGRALAVSQRGTLYALRPDGGADWVYRTNRPPSSRVLPGARGVLYFVSRNALVAASVRGGLLWSAQLGEGLAAPPVTDTAGAPWLLTLDGVLHAVPTPAQHRRFRLGGSGAGQLVVRDKTIAVVQDNQLTLINTADGTVIWRRGGVQQVASEQGVFGASLRDGTLVWLDEQSGAAISAVPLSADASAAPLLLPGVAFVPSVDGTVWAVLRPKDGRAGPRTQQCPVGAGPVGSPQLSSDRRQVLVTAGDGMLVALGLAPGLRATPGDSSAL